MGYRGCLLEQLHFILFDLRYITLFYKRPNFVAVSWSPPKPLFRNLHSLPPYSGSTSCNSAQGPRFRSPSGGTSVQLYVGVRPRRLMKLLRQPSFVLGQSFKNLLMKQNT
jgi:hypothetical protein